VWNEEFEFDIVDEINDFIDITVYDWDKTGNNDFLGVASVPVAMVTNLGRPLVQWFPLLDKFAATTTHSKQERGQIHVQIIYTDASGKTHSGTGAAPAQAAAAQAPQAQAHPMQQQMQQPQMMQQQMQPQMMQPQMMQPQMMQPMMQPQMMQPQMMMPPVQVSSAGVPIASLPI
jgi:hypothetical protein